MFTICPVEYPSYIFLNQPMFNNFEQPFYIENYWNFIYLESQIQKALCKIWNKYTELENILIFDCVYEGIMKNIELFYN
jgi:hypothetical protein